MRDFLLDPLWDGMPVEILKNRGDLITGAGGVVKHNSKVVDVCGGRQRGVVHGEAEVVTGFCVDLGPVMIMSDMSKSQFRSRKLLCIHVVFYTGVGKAVSQNGLSRNDDGFSEDVDQRSSGSGDCVDV